MREKDYLARLTRTARWRLPTKEADDIIEDYTELLMIDFRPYEDQIGRASCRERVCRIV